MSSIDPRTQDQRLIDMARVSFLTLMVIQSLLILSTLILLLHLFHHIYFRTVTPRLWPHLLLSVLAWLLFLVTFVADAYYARRLRIDISPGLAYIAMPVHTLPTFLRLWWAVQWTALAGFTACRAAMVAGLWSVVGARKKRLAGGETRHGEEGAARYGNEAEGVDHGHRLRQHLRHGDAVVPEPGQLLKNGGIITRELGLGGECEDEGEGGSGMVVVEQKAREVIRGRNKLLAAAAWLAIGTLVSVLEMFFVCWPLKDLWKSIRGLQCGPLTTKLLLFASLVVQVSENILIYIAGHAIFSKQEGSMERSVKWRYYPVVTLGVISITFGFARAFLMVSVRPYSTSLEELLRQIEGYSTLALAIMSILCGYVMLDEEQRTYHNGNRAAVHRSSFCHPLGADDHGNGYVQSLVNERVWDNDSGTDGGNHQRDLRRKRLRHIQSEQDQLQFITCPDGILRDPSPFSAVRTNEDTATGSSWMKIGGQRNLDHSIQTMFPIDRTQKPQHNHVVQPLIQYAGLDRRDTLVSNNGYPYEEDQEDRRISVATTLFGHRDSEGTMAGLMAAKNKTRGLSYAKAASISNNSDYVAPKISRYGSYPEPQSQLETQRSSLSLSMSSVPSPPPPPPPPRDIRRHLVSRGSLSSVAGGGRDKRLSKHEHNAPGAESYFHFDFDIAAQAQPTDNQSRGVDGTMTAATTASWVDTRPGTMITTADTATSAAAAQSSSSGASESGSTVVSSTNTVSATRQDDTSGARSKGKPQSTRPVGNQANARHPPLSSPIQRWQQQEQQQMLFRNPFEPSNYPRRRSAAADAVGEPLSPTQMKQNHYDKLKSEQAQADRALDLATTLAFATATREDSRKRSSSGSSLRMIPVYQDAREHELQPLRLQLVPVPTPDIAAKGHAGSSPATPSLVYRPVGGETSRHASHTALPSTMTTTACLQSKKIHDSQTPAQNHRHHQRLSSSSVTPPLSVVSYVSTPSSSLSASPFPVPPIVGRDGTIEASSSPRWPVSSLAPPSRVSKGQHALARQRHGDDEQREQIKLEEKEDVGGVAWNSHNSTSNGSDNGKGHWIKSHGLRRMPRLVPRPLFAASSGKSLNGNAANAHDHNHHDNDRNQSPYPIPGLPILSVSAPTPESVGNKSPPPPPPRASARAQPSQVRLSAFSMPEESPALAKAKPSTMYFHSSKEGKIMSAASTSSRLSSKSMTLNFGRSGRNNNSSSNDHDDDDLNRANNDTATLHRSPSTTIATAVAAAAAPLPTDSTTAPALPVPSLLAPAAMSPPHHSLRASPAPSLAPSIAPSLAASVVAMSPAPVLSAGVARVVNITDRRGSGVLVPISGPSLTSASLNKDLNQTPWPSTADTAADAAGERQPAKRLPGTPNLHEYERVQQEQHQEQHYHAGRLSSLISAVDLDEFGGCAAVGLSS